MTSLPGPGDPATWGPPMGHPNDPRTADTYGDCDICEDETSDVLDAGIDADEDGQYGWIVFRCEDCRQLISDMEDDPEEWAKRIRQAREEYALQFRPEGSHHWLHDDIYHSFTAAEQALEKGRSRGRPVEYRITQRTVTQWKPINNARTSQGR